MLLCIFMAAGTSAPHVEQRRHNSSTSTTLVDAEDWARFGSHCVQYLDLLERWDLLPARAEVVKCMDARWRPVGNDGTLVGYAPSGCAAVTNKNSPMTMLSCGFQI